MVSVCREQEEQRDLQAKIQLKDPSLEKTDLLGVERVTWQQQIAPISYKDILFRFWRGILTTQWAEESGVCIPEL